MTALPLVGDQITLAVGPVAHGGHCVARWRPPDRGTSSLGAADGRDGARSDGLVVFVRHALPGERVVAEVTEVHRDYLRADAVRIESASPDRVSPPCPYARPGRCGGCDLQHVAPAAQREWKAMVVREQLTRLAGLTAAEIEALRVRVSALPVPAGPADLAGTAELLGWRTRVRYAVDAAGRPGLLAHRSHQVVPVDRCRIAHPAIQQLPVTSRDWPDADAVETVVSGAGEVVVRAVRGDAVTPVLGPDRVREHAAGRDWVLAPGVFWQVHPAAADTLAAAVVELLAPAPGESAWDLYGGAGLFSAALAPSLGRVTLIESLPAAVAAARANLADLRTVSVVRARVEAALRQRRMAGPVDLVVLDPPRAGAGAAVVRAVVAAGPRAVAYVACDPAAFGRDVRSFRAAGWSLVALRGYDCFPMTHHVELVGLLVREPR